MAIKLSVVINSPSNSAKVLATSLGVLRVRSNRVNSTRRTRLFINWGNRFELNQIKRNKILNLPSSVALAADKRAAWGILLGSGVVIPNWTNNKEMAQQWAGSDKVLARSTATGSGGAGITVIEKGGTVPDSLFYVQYIRKSAEYRFHVVRDKVILKQQKRRRNGIEQSREQQLIRNHSNGWVFAENNLSFISSSVEDKLINTAVESVRLLGLDFGAVDLIVEQGTNNVVFLEVNTRPGLESTRLINAYTNAFIEISECEANGGQG
jgi:glutathione synthase/RimK-type ligase-like ATP-grasp enzyme